MISSSTTAADTDEIAGGPSSTVRLIVTLLLLWHLFAVGLAWVTDPMTFPTGVTSSLLAAVKERAPLVTPYLETLWLDLGYDFRYTYAQSQDVGCVLQADVGSGDSAKSQLIPDPAWPERKRQQYQQLVNRVAAAAARGDEGDETAGRLL